MRFLPILFRRNKFASLMFMTRLTWPLRELKQDKRIDVNLFVLCNYINHEDGHKEHFDNKINLSKMKNIKLKRIG